MLDTLANVKARLGITTGDYDSFLTQQIQLISQVIERYCRRKFLAATYIQTFYYADYRPSSMLELYHFPLIQVLDVDQGGQYLEESLYRAHKPTARLVRNDGGHFFWTDPTTVTYRAGYETCPIPVLAVLDALVSERYNKKTAGVDLDFGANVQRISIPGAISLDFDYTLTSNERSSAYGTIIGNYANVLDDWRSERAVLGTSKLEYVEEVP